MSDFISGRLPAGTRQHPEGFHGLIACRYCDTLHVRDTLDAGQTASCRCCGSTLYRHDRGRRDARLPLVLAALMLFVLGNLYPIAEVNLQGLRVQSTLWGCLRRLYEDGMVLLAGFLFITILLLPALELALMAWVLLRTGHRRPRPSGALVRLLNRLPMLQGLPARLLFRASGIRRRVLPPGIKLSQMPAKKEHGRRPG